MHTAFAYLLQPASKQGEEPLPCTMARRYLTKLDRLLAVLCTLIVLAVPVFAEDLKELRTNMLAEILTPGTPTSEQRKSLANWIAAECEAILEKTPSLSPREQDWLNKETKEGRFEQAYQSPEYSKDFIRTNAQSCWSLSHIIPAIASEKQEMRYWASLIRVLLESDWGWHVENARTKGGVIALTDNDVSTAKLFEMYGKRLYNKIILPYVSDLAENG